MHDLLAIKCAHKTCPSPGQNTCRSIKVVNPPCVSNNTNIDIPPVHSLPGNGSFQAAVTILGLMMAKGRPAPSVCSTASARAWTQVGRVNSFIFGFYLSKCVGVWPVTNHHFGHLRSIKFLTVHPLKMKMFKCSNPDILRPCSSQPVL